MNPRVAQVAIGGVEGQRRIFQSNLEALLGLVQRLLEALALDLRADAGEQLARAERFHQIVVSAGGDALHHGLFTCARGKK